MSLTESEAAMLVSLEGWVVDDLARARLGRLLARAPVDIAGIAPIQGPIPAGSSYRVHAEHLAGRAVAAERSEGAVHPALLMRPGFEHRRQEDGFVADGPVLVDHGSHAFNPWAETGALEPADPAGRSPFARRPTVVLLQGRSNPEEDLADWARRIVNGLMRHDVEARLAMFDVSPGLHLTRPCAPVEESIHALRPDVVIALDDAAAEVAPVWCRQSRSTVLVELALDPTVTIELVSWRIGDDHDRLRARIGQAVDVGPLARLVNRLCAGPQPAPPPRDEAAGPNVVRIRPSSPSERSLVVVSRAASAEDSRLHALCGYAAGAGLRVDVVDPNEARAAIDADVVMVGAEVDATAVVELADERRRRGQSTVADVTTIPVDVTTRQKLEACRYATVPSQSMRVAAELRDAHTQLVPDLLAPSELVRLEAARVVDPETEPTVIGVLAEPGSRPEVDALRAALATIRADRPQLSIEWTTGDGRPGFDVMSGWRALVWLGSLERATTIGRPRPLVEASLLGVPTVFARAHAPEVVDPVLSRHAIGEAQASDDWLTSLRGLFDPATPSRRRVAGRADALYGRKASASLCRRVIGWASRRGSRP
jgi:hypothetical protein